MSNNRRVGREYALKVLFALQLDKGQVQADQLLATFLNNFHFADDVLGEPLDAGDVSLTTAARLFTEQIVNGVVEYRSVIDKNIAEVAKNWSLERMAPVDLSILRIATFEILYQPDTPAAVVIDEAIEISKRYGTKDSPSFINGLLDKIAKNARTINRS
ncbi:NusB antitermination factor [Desulfuromusa kysingii]|uniref:Transcription antitermination protein NusB n=1 Tax=Desulfuromusa kysingii TaxID=37625 RepID=A0A1H4D3T9_9BACT|nr:transcription antitermination factor NusB [Desulfuromusa kysingii]SEA67251.1 NusB antitermination factor [Desulfuromusa kysingii]